MRQSFGATVLFAWWSRGWYSSAHRRLFDPKRFHVVLFDQRGCGQSQPCASLDDNSTDMLIDDMEALRQSLDIDKLVLLEVLGQHWLWLMRCLS